MEDKKRLEKLNVEEQKIQKQLEDLKMDIYDNPDNEKYEECVSDEVRKEKFPKLYELYTKIAELDSQKDTLIEEIEALEEKIEKEERINEGKQRYEEVSKEIEAGEKEIQTKQSEYEVAMKEIKDLDDEIAAIKETEEYKNGDEDTVSKVQKLEKQQQKKIIEKNQVVKALKETRKHINELQKAKEKLVEEYGKEILPVMEEEISTPDEQEQESPEPQQDDKKIDSNNEENKKKNENKPKQKNNQNFQNIGSNPATNQVANPVVPNRLNKQVPAEDKLKQEFDGLYSKAKKDELTTEEYTKLAEIMKDPSKYDELGITTGIVFNKSKVILKSMARMAAKTGKTVKLSKEKLGIEIEKASEDNGYLSTPSIKEWKGLKILMNNPEQKIASEELFKKIVEADREALNDEQKLVWDSAKEHLNQFETLRSSLQTYTNVSKQRSQKRWSWLFEYEKETPKPLASAPKTQPAPNPLGKELADQVEKEPKYGRVDSKVTSRDEQEQTK